MRNRFFLAITFFIVAGIVFYVGAQLRSGGDFTYRAVDKENLVVDSLSISGVSQLINEGVSNVKVFNSDKDMMVVTYDGSYCTNNSKVDENKLLIHFGVDQVEFFDFTVRPDIKVEIYSNSLDTLINKGTGYINGEDTAERASLYVLNEGVGSVDFSTRAKSVVAKNRGLGSLDLFGLTNELFAINEGVGSVNTKKLVALNVKARNSGVGSVAVYASDSLDLANDGVGSLRYSGSGKVYAERNAGIGSVKREK